MAQHYVSNWEEPLGMAHQHESAFKINARQDASIRAGARAAIIGKILTPLEADVADLRRYLDRGEPNVEGALRMVARLESLIGNIHSIQAADWKES